MDGNEKRKDLRIPPVQRGRLRARVRRDSPTRPRIQGGDPSYQKAISNLLGRR